MKLLINLLFGVLLASAVASCTKVQDPILEDEQPIVKDDSSGITGRLYIIARNSNNTTNIENATVKLFSSYEDARRDFTLFRVNTDNNGKADFGFVLQGNYYVVGSATVGSNLFTDTIAIQVIPKQTITRYLYLE